LTDPLSLVLGTMCCMSVVSP